MTLHDLHAGFYQWMINEGYATRGDDGRLIVKAHTLTAAEMNCDMRKMTVPNPCDTCDIDMPSCGNCVGC